MHEIEHVCRHVHVAGACRHTLVGAVLHLQEGMACLTRQMLFHGHTRFEKFVSRAMLVMLAS